MKIADFIEKVANVNGFHAHFRIEKIKRHGHYEFDDPYVRIVRVKDDDELPYILVSIDIIEKYSWDELEMLFSF